MFEIPQWADDVPGSTVIFSGKLKKNKRTKAEILKPKTKNKITRNEKIHFKKDKRLKSKVEKHFKSKLHQSNQNKSNEINRKLRNSNKEHIQRNTSIPRNTMNNKNKLQNVLKTQKHQNSEIEKRTKEDNSTIHRQEKNNDEVSCSQQMETDNTLELQNINADISDEILLNAKKKKFNENILKYDNEVTLFKETNNTLESQNINADISDEILLIAKKKKCNDNILKYDNEITLFKETNNTLESQNINADISDEILLNAKKKKCNDNILKYDNEITLFKETNNTLESQNINADISDEILLNAKKKKCNDNILKYDNEVTLFKGTNFRKEKIKQMFKAVSHRNNVTIKGNKLRDRMLEKLKAAQFRYLNEKLYTSSGSDAHTLFQSDPKAFEVYHQGYQQQLKKWPVNPLDVIVKRIAKLPKAHIIADMGCGEASLSKRVPHTVRSFDLISSSPDVEECDMAHTPLLAASVDVAVYCLALMGTDLTQYLLEANRVLKDGGLLLIAEVESRFGKVETFVQDVQRLGFKLKNLDKSQQVFFFMEFVKVREPPAKKSKLPVLTLKPCLYKRR